jgi:O-antigen ligase
MKIARALGALEAKKVQTFILLGGVFTTLAVWTKLEDPINLPKMFVLVLTAAIVLGLAIPAFLGSTRLMSVSRRVAIGLVGLFLLGLLISTFATDVKYTAIFGEYHRNNGALSYFAMAILLGASALVFNLGSSIRFFKYFAITGLLITFYGLLQTVNLDPIDWVIIYNPLITTLGNPNFTSGLLGLSGVAILYLALASKKQKTQVAYVVGLLANLFVLWRSGSIQGVFGFAIGAAVVILVRLWLISKKFGQIGLALSVIAGIPVALTIANIGPLASKLYQGTLNNRLDYWQAAFAMFKDHPIFGVGIDRFGEYYRQYAVQNQVVQGQITDNAHSIYMQILATGGLVAFVPYLFMIIFITVIGIRSLLSHNQKDKLAVSGVLGVWLATISINIVTVDNLGVGVWFWITGGVLIAISSKQDASDFKGENRSFAEKEKTGKKSAHKSRKNPSAQTEFPVHHAFAAVLVLVSMILLVPTLSNSSNLKSIKEKKGAFSSTEYSAEINSQAQDNWNSSQNLLQLSVLAFQNSDLVTGDSILDRIFQLDKRSYYANYFRAFTLESVGRRIEAIQYRESLLELDPWGSDSQVELIKNYLVAGDKESAIEVAALIKRNYPGSQADIDASALLGG